MSNLATNDEKTENEKTVNENEYKSAFFNYFSFLKNIFTKKPEQSENFPIWTQKLENQPNGLRYLNTDFSCCNQKLVNPFYHGAE